MSVTERTKAQPGVIGMSKGLLLTIQQTIGQGNPPAVSGEATLRIPSTGLFKRNERYASINLFRASLKPSFSAYLVIRTKLYVSPGMNTRVSLSSEDIYQMTNER
ncbi:unnamed protein product [Protopolystoma xenopodis]|uniref:Uncharacterized protein n=1 Tax=Protopolystoma xenopodis TaxID=117903 RepID=A0A448WA67_9PLAT|nr:unnamed protein product [Protopolystoma xenopodis]